MRSSHAWMLGWPAACIYAALINPVAGLVLLVVGAWLTWRFK